MRFMLDYHKDSTIVKEMNITFIALILKCGKPETMKDFKPISLVGCIYKLLAKVLANCVKKVMNLVIGESQMAFVNDRQIEDSFVIVEDIIHLWK
ncbi:hypothetical protein Dsin_012584 [Dipteronia sinensis]|uniref:Reverse transcriptase domain-containing protein n=1 Tax=Dipteronia sinensis TaxID=43782 RepID=A0AAE0AJK0_9ROSI|nr:hypothetical protein Dsin_012584 [Dipteronia sinensis]